MTRRAEVFRAPLPAIPSGCSLHDDLIIYREGDHVSVAPNRCRHQGGKFKIDEDGCLVCPRHGWQLDPHSMQYVSPVGMTHSTFEIVKDGLDIIAIAELSDYPWEADSRVPAPLKPSELSVQFLAHACVEIRCGDLTIVTDPWLVGPAFSRGWWLAHNPPSNWLELLSKATAIYISHNHSDHLNRHTLERLAAVHPEVPIFVPDFGTTICEHQIRQAGMRNVTAAPFDEWITLDNDTRFMILRDATDREDSGILIDYRGHHILNSVDCSNLNNGVLPSKVDVLLSSFAGGASGFPVCWADLYPDEEIVRLITRNRAAELARVRDLVNKVNPDVYIPFAGYFTEAHPADFDIRRLNVKNTPQRAIAAAEQNSGTRGWAPTPGAILDVAAGSLPTENAAPRTSWDNEFLMYVEPINASFDFAPLQDLEGVQQYFDWVSFHGDLVLHVIETDEFFRVVIREFFVDFRSVTVTDQRPRGEYRYLRMRVRASSFRHVLRMGHPWEELSIGFQARFYREPDRYNFDFWNHMQNNIPSHSPWGQEACDF